MVFMPLTTHEAVDAGRAPFERRKVPAELALAVDREGFVDALTVHECRLKDPIDQRPFGFRASDEVDCVLSLIHIW